MDKGDFLPRQKAQRLIRKILASGTFVFTKHAEREMTEDFMTGVDVENVLRGGTIKEEGEMDLRSQAVRYRVHTANFCVVVEFGGDDEFVVITAWRK